MGRHHRVTKGHSLASSIGPYDRLVDARSAGSAGQTMDVGCEVTSGTPARSGDALIAEVPRFDITGERWAHGRGDMANWLRQPIGDGERQRFALTLRCRLPTLTA